MPAEDRILKVLLRLIADTKGGDQVVAKLKEVEAQAGKSTLSQREVMRQYEAVAQRTGETVEQVRSRFEGATQEANNTASAASNLGSGIASAAGVGVTAGLLLYRTLSDIALEIGASADRMEVLSSKLVSQAREWTQLAKAAGDFGDSVKLGDKVIPQIEAFEQHAKDLGRELGLTDRMWLNFRNGLTQLPFISPSGLLKPQLEAERQDAESAAATALAQANAALSSARRAAAAFEQLKNSPFDEAVARQAATVSDLEAKLQRLDSARKNSLGALKDYQDAATEYDREKTRLEQLTQVQQRFNNAIETTAKQIREIDLKGLDSGAQTRALGGELTNIQNQIRALGLEANSPAGVLEAIKHLTTSTRESREEALRLAGEWAQVQSRINEAAAAAAKVFVQGVRAVADVENQAEVLRLRNEGSDALADQLQIEYQIGKQRDALLIKYPEEQDAINATMNLLQEQLLREKEIARARKDGVGSKKEERDVMRELTAQRSFTESDPFALTADKRARLIPILQEEARALRAAGKEWEALRVEQELATHTFSGELQAGLVAWVNGFGTAAEQTSNFITGTLNNAISQVSGNIAQAIWRTGEWSDIWVSLGETATQQLIQMGLQMLIQHLLSETLNEAAHQRQMARNVQATASATPAAVAQTGASSGSNWIIGAVVAAIAIGALVAALSGGFEKGGYTGGRRRRIAGVVHGEEFVHDAESVDRLGVQNLEALRSGQASIVRHYADGGRVEQHAGSEAPPLVTGFGPWDGKPGSPAWRDGTYRWGPNGRVPLIAGDIALSPDLAANYHRGDIITFTLSDGRMMTGRYVDVTRGDLTNRIDVWTKDKPFPGAGDVHGSITGTTPVGNTTAAASPTPSSLFISPTTTLRNDSPSDRLAIVGGFRYIDLANVPADPRNTGLLADAALGQQELDLIARINASLGAQESDLIGSIQQNRDSVTYNADGSVTVVGGSGVGNPRLQTPWGRATPNDYSLGGTIPTNGQDWTYGGNDAPIGSIVGSVNGQPVVQTANGRQVLPGVQPGTLLRGGVTGGNYNWGAGMGGTGLAGTQNFINTGDVWNSGRPAIDTRAQNAAWMDDQSHFGNPNIRLPDMPGYDLEGNAFQFARMLNAPGHETQKQAQARSGATTAQLIAMIAAGNHWPGHADGVRLPGGPSMTDTIPAMLAAGEGIIKAPAMQWADKRFGQGWFEAINEMRFDSPMLHMADGGRVAVNHSPEGDHGHSGHSQTMRKQQQWIIVADIEAAVEHRLKTPQYESHIVKAVHKWRR